MNGYFKRQLVDYVEYHRDPRNCLIHVFGIAFLFLGAVLPFTQVLGLLFYYVASWLVAGLAAWLLAAAASKNAHGVTSAWVSAIRET